MSHPLERFKFRIRSFKSISSEPGEMLSFSAINLIVGRNNSGKSSIIDALKFILEKGKGGNPEHQRNGEKISIEISSILTDYEVSRVFRQDTRSAGNVSTANDWIIGQRLVNAEIVRAYDFSWQASWISGPAIHMHPDHLETFQQQLAEAVDEPVANLIHISAERDARPEGEQEPGAVQPNGNGLTNLVRGFLYDSRYPMAEVERRLLDDLNLIYMGDAQFSRILCRRDPSGAWEIYLTEVGQAPIRLSQLGSSLRTIFIILATIRLNPIVQSKSLKNAIFCVEEPENNLHPALLRRLLSFLADFTAKSEASLVITSHSSAAIDWAARRKDAATFHVLKGSVGSSVHQVKEYRAARELISDLDIRASELLQANGVIWVEGPSDRLYVRHWIDVLSKGTLVEGIHYSIMFYGGKLLSHLSCLPLEEARSYISLLRINRNLAVIIDSDKRILPNGRYRSHINDTKKRISDEVSALSGMVWVTFGREIENYIDESVISSILGAPVSVNLSDSVPDLLKAKAGDKISLAHRATSMTDEKGMNVLDLMQKVADLCDLIRSWNGIK